MAYSFQLIMSIELFLQRHLCPLSGSSGDRSGEHHLLSKMQLMCHPYIKLTNKAKSQTATPSRFIKFILINVPANLSLKPVYTPGYVFPNHACMYMLRNSHGGRPCMYQSAIVDCLV